MANPVLFGITRLREYQKSLSGVTRKALLVSNNGRIYVSHAVEKKEGTTGGRTRSKMQDLLQLKWKTLENQGLRPLPENVAIILDFFRNVKMKSEQIIDKLYNKNVD